MIELKITVETPEQLQAILEKLNRSGVYGTTTASQSIAAWQPTVDAVKKATQEFVQPIIDKVVELGTESDEDQMEFDGDHLVEAGEKVDVTLPEATTAPAEKPKKSRAPKKAKGEPVVVIDNTKETHVAKMAEATAAPVAIPDEPKNFYSEKDFKLAFVKIMSELVKNGTLTQEFVAERAKYYGVTYIFTIVDDAAKVTHFFEHLVKEGHITRKADY